VCVCVCVCVSTLRAGDEEVRRVTDHNDEVSESRRIHCAASARPHNNRQLRMRVCVCVWSEGVFVLFVLVKEVKSVREGEDTAPPAHGPIMTNSCGTTASVFVLLY
jgi:hypothetical protein